jgi:methionyl-tRNA formyltransferase
VSDDTFIFVGNRRFVLEQMLREGIRVSHAFVIKNTHLERDIVQKTINLENIETVVVESKMQFLTAIRCLRFDVLVSNGCPYILPISTMPPAKYINIHPSLLPDLRGIDPVIGAILHQRDAGATCHVMDEGIDTGDIISQVRIPWSEDLDVTTLYQLSFLAEQESFTQALNRDFQAREKQINRKNLIYYNRKPEDGIVTFRESNPQILQKIKAFNNRTAGCEFFVGVDRYKVFYAAKLHNPFLWESVGSIPEGVVAFSYENDIVFGKDGEALRFHGIVPVNMAPAIKVGTRIFGVENV